MMNMGQIIATILLFMKTSRTSCVAITVLLLSSTMYAADLGLTSDHIKARYGKPSILTMKAYGTKIKDYSYVYGDPVTIITLRLVNNRVESARYAIAGIEGDPISPRALKN